jgi:hypothetical protein
METKLNSKVVECKKELANLISKYTFNVFLVSFRSLFLDWIEQRKSKKLKCDDLEQFSSLILEMNILNTTKWDKWEYLTEDDHWETLEISIDELGE